MTPPPGALRWAVKASFVRYVRVIAAGTVEASGGAVLDAADVVTFPLVTDVLAAGSRVLGFGGAVRYTAHHGALDVTLAGLRIDLGPAGGGLSIVAGGERRIIADLPSDGGPPILTREGVPVFGDVYPAGTGLAPLGLDVPIDS
ncbi:HtaA domain-containing protein [Actinoplanes sp. NPDC051851]|uniref:HtaA domain-containing protein n=1 Tax=Actinoplanes sp. NPDC051851 TaxID=3154753 RepID=UPI0034462CE7